MGFFTHIKLPQDLTRIKKLAEEDKPECKNFTHISATLLYSLIVQSLALTSLQNKIKNEVTKRATEKGKV